MKTSAVVIALSLISLATQVFAQSEPKEMPLWPDKAPLANGTETKDIPTVIVSMPQESDSKAPRAALVICPGGGYGNLAMDHEGKQIAEWASNHGMVAAICNYRHRGKGYGHPVPLMDAQRAIRFVRAHASKWNIDPARVGILGFSAGGHLTSTVLTHTQAIKPDMTFATSQEVAANADAIDQQNSRPDFGILCYPVIGMGVDFTHKGSEKNLFGPNPTPELLAQYNNYEQVTSDTPPTFLFHTQEDTAVPPRNSVEFYAAMVRSGVPGELHIFEKGRHGVGLGRDVEGTKEWSDLAVLWLKNRKVLP